ncbi:MAG: hypothetical protein K4571_20555 [Deltaproteobacteria bacterium]
MKNIIHVLLTALAVSLFVCGCVVTPQPAPDTRPPGDRPVYSNDRPRPYDVDISDINQRIAQMDQRIDQGMGSGALTRDEGRRLRMELNRVRNDAARMKRDGILTLREKDRLNAELDRLQRDIYREARDDDRRRNQQIDISDINQRIAEMDQRIDQGMASGALTRDEGRRLRMELNRVRDDAARMKRDGVLTLREKDRLNAELDRLKRDIYREARDDDRRRNQQIDISDINQRIAEMDQRIDQGMRNGALTRDEGRRLRMELNRVRDDAARMKRDGILTQREKDRLNGELDRLKRDIYREAKDDDRRRNQQVDISDINQRMAQMNRSIDQGMASGSLTGDEVQAARALLNRVRDDAARMKRDGILTQREKDQLNGELDRQQKEINRAKSDRDKRRK